MRERLRRFAAVGLVATLVDVGIAVALVGWGWPVIAAPAGVRDTPFRLRFKLNDGRKQIRIAWHEYLGLVAYRLNGRIETLWPAI